MTLAGVGLAVLVLLAAAIGRTVPPPHAPLSASTPTTVATA